MQLSDVALSAVETGQIQQQNFLVFYNYLIVPWKYMLRHSFGDILLSHLDLPSISLLESDKVVFVFVLLNLTIV